QGGAATFLDGETRVTITRSFLTAGYLFYFLMLILTRKGPGGQPVLTDERDDQIIKRALTSAFYILLVYVFLINMFLYVFYKIHLKTAEMPVGWMWFLGVSAFCIGYIGHAGSTLIQNSRMGDNAEG
ncbi:MAG: hypothetical protein MUP70_16170, partial [Candidatus Aminicenantes bacterium]|nr:hypothetical protein [Candidatus Aminicenantes bacterium]